MLEKLILLSTLIYPVLSLWILVQLNAFTYLFEIFFFFLMLVKKNKNPIFPIFYFFSLTVQPRNVEGTGCERFSILSRLYLNYNVAYRNSISLWMRCNSTHWWYRTVISCSRHVLRVQRTYICSSPVEISSTEWLRKRNSTHFSWIFRNFVKFNSSIEFATQKKNLEFR